MFSDRNDIRTPSANRNGWINYSKQNGKIREQIDFLSMSRKLIRQLFLFIIIITDSEELSRMRTNKSQTSEREFDVLI